MLGDRRRELPPSLAHVERLGDRGHDELRARDGREADEERAVAELGLERVRDGEAETSLARPSRAGEGNEPRALVTEQCADRRELQSAAHERRGRYR